MIQVASKLHSMNSMYHSVWEDLRDPSTGAGPSPSYLNTSVGQYGAGARKSINNGPSLYRNVNQTVHHWPLCGLNSVHGPIILNIGKELLRYAKHRFGICLRRGEHPERNIHQMPLRLRIPPNCHHESRTSQIHSVKGTNEKENMLIKKTARL